MRNADYIVCIDDERIILKLIRAQLISHFGNRYNYLMFETAEEAYQEVIKLKNNRQNVVMAIVDQILPGKQGTDFLTEVSNIFPNVVKILFSGRSDFKAILQAINEAEIFRYLIKPWNKADFLQIVDRGLQQYYSKKNTELQLAEIHHRVKNNLTIITCLLELQISKLKDPNSKSHFQKSINRINSIAEVHELIYASEDMVSVDINDYIINMIPSIKQSMNVFHKPISFDLKIPSHKLLVTQAIPLGLIFNELITNSLKYAFNDLSDGKISIQMLIDDNRIKFIYEDNGHGFDSDKSFSDSKNLGLNLIQLQLQQLDSIYVIESRNKFKLEFSFNSERAKFLNDSIKGLSPILS